MLFGIGISAQVSPQEFLGLRAISTTDRKAINTANLAQGMLVIDSDLDQLFYFDGTQWVGVQKAASADMITNELFFEDDDYCYISLLVGTSSYSVARYNKSDINDEAIATGTGAQPTTLAAVQALTY